jgi:phosphoserine phosphatase
MTLEEWAELIRGLPKRQRESRTEALSRAPYTEARRAKTIALMEDHEKLGESRHEIETLLWDSFTPDQKLLVLWLRDNGLKIV